MMSKLTLVTGGARSGKSTFAELLAAHPGLPVIYIATAQIYDDEMAVRVKKHREQRPDNWRLIEEPLDIPLVLENLRCEKAVILLDCVTLWLSNHLLRTWPASAEETINSEEVEKSILDQVRIVAHLAKEITPEVILVTNEVGSGIVPDNPLSRSYRDLAGRANQILGKAANKVYHVVSGYPLEIKGPGQALLDALTPQRTV